MTGQKLDDVQDKLRGPAGTKVTLSIMREGLHDPFDVKLTRAGDLGRSRDSQARGRCRLHQNTGLQRAHRYAVCARRSRRCKKEIGPGIKGYIVDLRDDGGGLLDQAIGVSDDFLDGGEIVSIRGRNKDETQRFDAKPGDITDGKPVIVLVNGGTASASEIVAGALQDHRRARIEGTLTFGKGSVQTIIPLDEGEAGALHMTTARYYTPSGPLDPDHRHRAGCGGRRQQHADAERISASHRARSRSAAASGGRGRRR